MPELPEKLSRRTLLRNASMVLGVTGSSALIASCQPMAQAPPPMAQPAPPPPPPMMMKQTKAQALYQDFPRGPQRCGVCIHFRPPNDCETIQGPVQANGWCRNFVPRFPGGERG